MVFFGSGSQCWYFSHDPSSLFHCSVLVAFSVSMMKQYYGVSEPLCAPNINCFLYKGLHLNLGRRFARSGGCP